MRGVSPMRARVGCERMGRNAGCVTVAWSDSQRSLILPRMDHWLEEGAAGRGPQSEETPAQL